MRSLKPLSEQVIVITGASSGIGLAAARMAAEKGARVVLVARNARALEEIVADIRHRGGKAAAFAVDVADEDAAERIARFADETFGGFDTWVNNASTIIYALLEEVSLAEHRRLFDIGYFGLVQGSLEAARHFKERFKDGGRGAIVNVGSVLSDRTVLLQGAYGAMKQAALGFTDAFRMELDKARAPISVTLIKPAGMDTPLPEHALNRLGKPARIPTIVYDPRLAARAILFAAEHPRRTLGVGGAGLALQLARWTPRLSDKGQEAFVDERAQTSDTPPEPGTADNLFEARADGRIDSNQDDHNVRRRSLYLEAQMRPVATAAILGGAAALLLGVAGRRSGATARRAADSSVGRFRPDAAG